MPVNLVQSASAYTTALSSPSTLTTTFTSPVTAGNTLLVLGGGNPNIMFPSGDIVSGINDPVGDSFTTVLNIGAPRNSGPAVFCFLVPTAVGGNTNISTTYSITPAVGGVQWPWGVLAIEMSGMAGPTVQDKNSINVFGGLGNTPVSIPITDSHSNTVTVVFNGTSGSGGPGTACTCSAVDLLVGGIDFLLAFILAQSGTTVPTANHGYGFVLTINDNGPTMTEHYFTPSLPFGPTGRRLQIFVAT